MSALLKESRVLEGHGVLIELGGRAAQAHTGNEELESGRRPSQCPLAANKDEFIPSFSYYYSSSSSSRLS